MDVSNLAVRILLEAAQEAGAPRDEIIADLGLENSLGPDPAAAVLARRKVALSSGPSFGDKGPRIARLNIGTTRALLEKAVGRMAGAAS